MTPIPEQLQRGHSDLPDRRRFLCRVSAAATAVLLPAAASAEPEVAAPDGTAKEKGAAKEKRDSKDSKLLPIIDTHQHLWDLRRFKLPWIKKGDPLAKSFLPEDYRKATEGLNVVKSVYMEVDVEPGEQDKEAEYVIDLCRSGKEPTVGAVISGRPSSEGFRKYIERHQKSPFIKGVRQVLHGESTPPGYCRDPRFVAGIRLLGELGLSFDLCQRPTELPDMAALIDDCPDTQFMLDHCGNAEVQTTDLSVWRSDIADVAKRKNVFGKISGIVASAKPDAWTADDLAPIVNHTLEVFGPDRVVFGGDWPVCTLAATFKEWVAALKEIVSSRSREEQMKLFHDNALAFYRLS